MLAKWVRKVKKNKKHAFRFIHISLDMDQFMDLSAW